MGSDQGESTGLGNAVVIVTGGEKKSEPTTRNIGTVCALILNPKGRCISGQSYDPKYNDRFTLISNPNIPNSSGQSGIPLFIEVAYSP